LERKPSRRAGCQHQLSFLLPARRYVSAIFAVERCLAVRLSVRPSHAGI